MSLHGALESQHQTQPIGLIVDSHFPHIVEPANQIGHLCRHHRVRQGNGETTAAVRYLQFVMNGPRQRQPQLETGIVTDQTHAPQFDGALRLRGRLGLRLCRRRFHRLGGGFPGRRRRCFYRRQGSRNGLGVLRGKRMPGLVTIQPIHTGRRHNQQDKAAQFPKRATTAAGHAGGPDTLEGIAAAPTAAIFQIPQHVVDQAHSPTLPYNHHAATPVNTIPKALHQKTGVRRRRCLVSSVSAAARLT